jgi:hypothetical protein
VPRAVIGRTGGRYEEASFKMEGNVPTALLDAEEGNAFRTAQLLILSDDFTHEVKPVKRDMFSTNRVNKDSSIVI